jgi:peptide/nickel transport system permease protein
VFVVVLILNFIIPHLAPGNFIEIYAYQIAESHHIPVQVVLARLANIYGQPGSLYSQLTQYMQEVLLTFPPNFGPSFEFYPLSAWSVVYRAIQWTLLLLGSSQIISWFVSIFFGVYLALREGKSLDRVLQPVFYFLNSIPAFWLGLMFIFLFAIELHFFPSGEAVGVTNTPLSVLDHMVLPISVLIITSLPTYVLVARSAAIDVMGSDFLQASKAEGLSPGTIVRRVLRNSFLPSITNLFLNIGYLIGGIITVEFTFSYPGVGTVIADAVLIKDYPTMLAAFYITTLVTLLANLAADLLYPLVDPRVSYAT